MKCILTSRQKKNEKKRKTSKYDNLGKKKKKALGFYQGLIAIMILELLNNVSFDL